MTATSRSCSASRPPATRRASAIVRGETLLADAIASSVDEHARFGGVVPEVASRAHLEAMVPTIERACATAGVTLRDVDAIAVTAGPGLAGALLVGVAAAKALALSLGLPLYGVNHLAAHVAVDIVEHGPLPEPTMAMLVSGGHSSLLLVPDVTADVRLARLDDRRCGGGGVRQGRAGARPSLPRRPVHRPGGEEGRPSRSTSPAASRRTATWSVTASTSPSAGSRPPSPAGSRRARRAGSRVPVADVAASFQEAVVDVLTRKALLACKEHGVDHLVIGGGVAANSRLRAMAQERCDAAGVMLRVPRPGLCTDNGAMVAALGAEMVGKGRLPSTSGSRQTRRCRSRSFRRRTRSSAGLGRRAPDDARGAEHRRPCAPTPAAVCRGRRRGRSRPPVALLRLGPRSTVRGRWRGASGS